MQCAEAWDAAGQPDPSPEFVALMNSPVCVNSLVTVQRMAGQAELQPRPLITKNGFILAITLSVFILLLQHYYGLGPKGRREFILKLAALGILLFAVAVSGFVFWVMFGELQGQAEQSTCNWAMQRECRERSTAFCVSENFTAANLEFEGRNVTILCSGERVAPNFTSTKASYPGLVIGLPAGGPATFFEMLFVVFVSALLSVCAGLAALEYLWRAAFKTELF